MLLLPRDYDLPPELDTVLDRLGARNPRAEILARAYYAGIALGAIAAALDVPVVDLQVEVRLLERQIGAALDDRR